MFVCVHFLLFRTHVKDTVLCVYVCVPVPLPPLSLFAPQPRHAWWRNAAEWRATRGRRCPWRARRRVTTPWSSPGCGTTSPSRRRTGEQRRRWVWLVWGRPRGADLASFVWQSGSRHQHGLPVDDCRVQCVSLMFNSKAKSLKDCCTWYRKNHYIFTQTRILTRVQTNGSHFQRIKVFSERLHFFFSEMHTERSTTHYLVHYK